MCGPPCTNCKAHVYSHGPREYHHLCYGCYAIVQNIPEEELQEVNGKVYPADSIVISLLEISSKEIPNPQI